ncbi:MAG: hypothetical protein H6744_16800 [Deltaproteobacteria bacterium]|nr:hypothetical protein [Deltaproteobacteria bacterium]MCB9788341.1 hypothetical protein [Deltaproteobacteria bacterium]
MTTESASNETLLAILAPALSDPAAGERRRRVLEADGRAEPEWRASLADLDAVVALLRWPSRAVDGHADTDEPGAAPEPALKEHPGDDGLQAAADAVDEGPTLGDAIPTRPPSKPMARVAPTAVDHARRVASLLYEDVIWLFSINDGEGALVSLERLLVLGQLEGEAAEFVRLNSDKLVDIYREYMGGFDAVPRKGDTELESMPHGYFDLSALASVHALVDGKRSIQALVEASDLPPLTTCAALEQLKRSRVLFIPDRHGERSHAAAVDD